MYIYVAEYIVKLVRCDDQKHFAPISFLTGKLMQESKVDLNAPVQQYVDYFPLKEYNGEVVAITMKQLMSHTSGIRHYEKTPKEKEAELNGEKREAEMSKDDRKSLEAVNEVAKEAVVHPEAGIKSGKDPEGRHNDKVVRGKEKDVKTKKEGSQSADFQFKEFYISKHFDTVKEAVDLFKDDPLQKMPGSDYLYTTHGWTLLSACIEGASGKDYVTYMKEMCYDLGLDNTSVELNDPIVYNRSKYVVYVAVIVHSHYLYILLFVHSHKLCILLFVHSH